MGKVNSMKYQCYHPETLVDMSASCVIRRGVCMIVGRLVVMWWGEESVFDRRCQ